MVDLKERKSNGLALFVWWINLILSSGAGALSGYAYVMTGSIKLLIYYCCCLAAVYLSTYYCYDLVREKYVRSNS